MRLSQISLTLLVLTSPAYAQADPVDLTDTRPRWVTVLFDDAHYTQPVRGWLSPSSTPGQVRVAISGEMVERSVLRNANPKSGSFSDFVWTFDSFTGEVVKAETTGVVTRALDFGLFRKKVNVEIRIDVGTSRVSGFRNPKRILGELVFDHCDDARESSCTIVRAQPYDQNSGYVNAVGQIDAHAAGVSSRAFAPIGEAVFLERPGQSDEVVASRTNSSVLSNQ